MKIIQPTESSYLEIIDAKFFGETFQKCSGAPDLKKFKNGRFLFSPSFSNLDHFLEVFPEAQWIGEAEKIRDKFFTQKSNEREMLDGKDKEIEIRDYPEVFKTKPFDHQLKAFELSKDAKNYGLFFEQGCGKTKVTIDTSTYLSLLHLIEAHVIIAPNGVHKNWITDELPTHCNIEYDYFCWDGKFNKAQKANFERVFNSKKLKIFAFNVECFVSEKQQQLLIRILKAFKTMLSIDESQTIKNPSAVRTKFILKIGELAAFRRILSGTPITKGIEDIYSQFKFLDANIIGLNSFFAFKAKYCQMGGYLQKQIIGYKGIEEIQEKIKTYTTRVLKKDCLDLPDKIYQKEPFALTEDQMRMYNEVKDEGMSYLLQVKEKQKIFDKVSLELKMLLSGNDYFDGDKEAEIKRLEQLKFENQPEQVTFESVLSRMKKLQQISSGFLMNIELGEFVEIVKPENNPRLLKLKEILSKIDGKVIIWTIFTADIKYMMAMLGNKAVRYDGKMTREDREASKLRFKTDPEAKYFVANLQAAARGITLTEATTAIYYNNSYDLELRLQSEDRCHRIGTTQNVLYIDLEASKTIDKKIIRALRSKKKVADMALQDPYSLFMENEEVEEPLETTGKRSFEEIEAEEMKEGDRITREWLEANQ